MNWDQLRIQPGSLGLNAALLLTLLLTWLRNRKTLHIWPGLARFVYSLIFLWDIRCHYQGQDIGLSAKVVSSLPLLQAVLVQRGAFMQYHSTGSLPPFKQGFELYEPVSAEVWVLRGPGSSLGPPGLPATLLLAVLIPHGECRHFQKDRIMAS